MEMSGKKWSNTKHIIHRLQFEYNIFCYFTCKLFGNHSEILHDYVDSLWDCLSVDSTIGYKMERFVAVHYQFSTNFRGDISDTRIRYLPSQTSHD